MDSDESSYPGQLADSDLGWLLTRANKDLLAHIDSTAGRGRQCLFGWAAEKVAGGVGVGHRVGVVDVEDQGQMERVGAGGQGFVQDAVAPDAFEGDAVRPLTVEGDAQDDEPRPCQESSRQHGYRTENFAHPLDYLLADRDACGIPAGEVLTVVPEQVVGVLADLRLGPPALSVKLS
jgi:hypothetical protein